MKLIAPLKDTFWFTDAGSPRKPELLRIEASEVDQYDKDKTFFVTFRQGTQGEDLERTNWQNRRKYTYDREAENMIEISELNPDNLARLEVSMTLMDTNLTFPDGSSLQFSKGESACIMDREQFNRWWHLFPTAWAREVYACCLEVNPDWASKRGLVAG